MYGVFTWSDVVICVKPVEICMNNSESKKRLLALQKSKFLSVEIQDALRFAIEKLSDAEYHDAQIPKPVMANKRWSQAEENQLVESLLAGNSIELIAANLSRSTNCNDPVKTCSGHSAREMNLYLNSFEHLKFLL